MPTEVLDAIAPSSIEQIFVIAQMRHQVLLILEPAQTLPGKNKFELSTGSASDAESLYQWANEQGAGILNMTNIQSYIVT